MRTEAVAVENPLFLNCIGGNQATGRFSLDDHDEPGLKWGGRRGDQKVFAEIEQLLIEFSGAMGGECVPAVVAHPTMTIVAQAIKTMDHALAPAP
jgi:hypothetical protein